EYELAAAYIFCFLQLFKLAIVRHPIKFIRKNWLEFVLVFLMFFQLGAGLAITSSPEYEYLAQHYKHLPLTQISLVFVQMYFLITAFIESSAFHRFLSRLKLQPVLMVAVSFASIIAAGGALLKLPKAVNPGCSLSWTDAFFTATSAVCVTGLGTVDTGTTFSLLGQIITMFLIQIGGLGVITFTVFMAFFSGEGIYGDDVKKIMVILDEDSGSAKAALFKIFAVTLAIEAMGAYLLFRGLNTEIADPVYRAYFALYHSVSAFCNAGFGLYADSLVKFRSDAFIMLVFCGLITAGSIGMPIIFNLPASLKNFMRGRFSEIPAHFKTVVGITFLLIAGGTLVFFLLAGTGFMDGFSIKDKFLSSLFLTITTRTCGFTSIDLSGLSFTVTWLCVLYMFIGGSPASTAGGIKTAGAGVLCAAAWKRLFKKPYEAVRLAGTVVISKTVKKAVIITVVLFLGALSASSFIYSIETFPFRKVVFEVVSAIATVGLSMGITADLSVVSKWVIIFCMYVGRVSPGIIVIMLNNRNPEKEDIILG
ncbi:MAG: potassium transporter TrkG, partial [Elusimicrobiaceae bacterium]